MKRLLVIVLILFSFFSGAQSLSGTKWVLVSFDNLDNGKSVMINSKTRATLNFDSDTIFSGGFCNKYKGQFKVLPEQKLNMNVSEVGKMVCLGISSREKELMGMYAKAIRYRLDKGMLFIFTSDKKRITFHKE